MHIVLIIIILKDIQNQVRVNTVIRDNKVGNRFKLQFNSSKCIATSCESGVERYKRKQESTHELSTHS